MLAYATSFGKRQRRAISVQRLASNLAPLRGFSRPDERNFPVGLHDQLTGNRMKLMRRSHSLAILAVSAILAGPYAAEAQEANATRERAGIVLGAFITERNTRARLDPNLGTGTDISLESDLGLDTSTTVFRFDAYVWLGRAKKNRIDFSVFDFSRSAAKRIDETIEFGDEVFEIDTVVSSQSDLTIVKADYTVAALDRERGYLGVTGGLYVADTRLRLREATFGSSETGELTAPLPVIGFRGEYEITDRITIRGASNWFSIDVDDASGRLADVYVGADYRIGRRFALGLAFNDVDMNLRAQDEGGFEGVLDWGYDGWLIYFKTDLGR